MSHSCSSVDSKGLWRHLLAVTQHCSTGTLRTNLSKLLNPGSGVLSPTIYHICISCLSRLQQSSSDPVQMLLRPPCDLQVSTARLWSRSGFRPGGQTVVFSRAGLLSGSAGRWFRSIGWNLTFTQSGALPNAGGVCHGGPVAVLTHGK